MKKVLYIIGGVILFLIITVVSLPLIFKDTIKAKIDEAIAERVNAQVYVEDFSLTFFKHFPSFTASLRNFGIVGYAPFEGDTLVAAKALDIQVNLWEIITGAQTRLSGIVLEAPRAHIKVNKDGKANYDIIITPPAQATDQERVDKEENTSSFNFGIDHWEIENGHIIYEDQTLDLYTEIKELHHQGSGNFAQAVFDLETFTTTQALTVAYQGTTYVADKILEVDATLNMNLPTSTFTFKENTIKINDFAFGFDGSFAMKEEAYEMDISFATKENSFKNLLSLVPSVYKEKFEDLVAEGGVQLRGFVKGVYNDKAHKLPAFQLALKVDEGMFKYPSVPTPIQNVNIAMRVDNPDGIMENTSIDVKQFQCNVGSSPVEGSLKLKGSSRYEIEAALKAQLNLTELVALYPVEGLVLKGRGSLSMKANGTYDSLRALIPKVAIAMHLKDGFVKHGSMPVPIDKVSLNATVKNTTGKMESTHIEVSDFKAMVEKEGIEGQLTVTNLKDYNWNLHLKGGMDLEKIMKIYPLKDTKLSGHIKANIASRGKMSDLEAERYHKLATSGEVIVENLFYQSDVLPQSIRIDKSEASFTPTSITIKRLIGRLGKSKMNITGQLSNYINYIFKENAVIKGSMNFLSPQFDLNEWAVEESTEVNTKTKEADPSASMEVIKVPKNIDFALNAKINRVDYTQLALHDLRGKVIINNGIANLKDVRFYLLDGKFTMDGAYNSSDLRHPRFNFIFTIDDLSIGQAYRKFAIVQKLAPIAESVEGRFSTNLALQGELGKDRMPVYPTLNGKGVIKTRQAFLKSTPTLTSIAKLANIDHADRILLHDLTLKTTIKNGRVHIDPFDIKIGAYNANISGSNGFEGSLDYLVKVEVPTGELGNAANKFIGDLLGINEVVPETVLLKFAVKGDYQKPKVNLVGTEQGKGTSRSKATNTQKNALEEKQEQGQQELQKRLEEGVDKLKDQLEGLFK
ncbi:MAG: AsmA family protein [Cytophagales bacterium]|nr:AsmA family protein [Cytophagales bacterium]